MRLQKGGTVGGREILYACQEIRICVSQFGKCLVIPGGNPFLQGKRHLLQQIIHKAAPVMGRVDCCKRSHIGRGTVILNGTAAVQSSFGMGNQIHLWGAGCLADRLNLNRQFPAAVLDRLCRLLAAVEQNCAVAKEFSRNPSPVIKVLPIPKENAVYQQNGVFRLADLGFLPHCVTGRFGLFHTPFPFGSAVNVQRQNPGNNWHPPDETQDQIPVFFNFLSFVHPY